MPNAKTCELNVRIPLDSKANAETIYQVLKVDLNVDQHEKFAKQELSVSDDCLCALITSTRAKDLRSCSSAFFESFLLCNEIINEFAPTLDDNNTN